MTLINELIVSLKSGEHELSDTLMSIDAHYDDQPQSLTNGPVYSVPGQNEGSCKVFGLAVLEGLSEKQALLAFGEHYRDVIASRRNIDHGNIRALIAYGLMGVKFDEPSLSRKA